jgi:arylsulfatase
MSCKSERPNILLIIADDLGYSDLGCYGGEIKTPHIDQLAQNGILLTRFYSTGRCCPSRASLLTGLYPHRAGLGHKVKDLGQPGYRGRIADDALTIAQVLKEENYRSFISGKWHLGTDDPTMHGFEEFYGTLVSAQTYWDLGHYQRLPEGSKVRTYRKDSFYGTDALTDHALDFLKEARNSPDKPWFLYMAYNAPHFPLHAPDEEISNYTETYEVGWDEIRSRRHVRMKRNGIIPGETKLSPRSQYWDYGEVKTGVNPAWEELPEDRRKDMVQRMAIYAAMIDIMDRNIGRLIQDLADHHELENTLVIFTSDNGACAEWDPYGFDIKSSPQNILHVGKQIEEMGSPGTYHSVGSGWANASNTPWRLYKHFNHEGGISSPCIFHWPKGLKRKGNIDDRPCHLIDLMPTILEVTGTKYPDRYNGNRTAALAGISILPLLQGDSLETRTICFEHEGNRAITRDPWKLTALKGQEWELYNIENDRTEMVNVSSKYPDIVNKLAGEWDIWAKNNFVTPLPKDLGVEYLKSIE